MLDTCVVKYETGVMTQDETTGNETPQYATRFTSPCRVKISAQGLAVQTAEAGGRTVATVVRELHLPIDSPAVVSGDLAVITAVDGSSDPTLLNAVLRIAGPAPGSQTTARRLQVEEEVA